MKVLSSLVEDRVGEVVVVPVVNSSPKYIKKTINLSTARELFYTAYQTMWIANEISQKKYMFSPSILHKC